MDLQRPYWIARGRTIVDDEPIIMGIVNITPNSFSDGGRTFTTDTAVEHALQLVAQGADILDLGGESSRPGANSISLDQELSRVMPVVERLRTKTSIPISIDTTKAEVARQTLGAGADIINDITALGDPEMAKVVLQFGAGVVLMHMAGVPLTMQADPRYRNVTDEVCQYLRARVELAKSAGIDARSIAIDPGIGFGKTFDHNLELLRNTETLATLGHAVLVGTSRKGLLGTLTGRPVHERGVASVTSSLLAVMRGASIARVHDVGMMVDALKVWKSLRH